MNSTNRRSDEINAHALAILFDEPGRLFFVIHILLWTISSILIVRAGLRVKVSFLGIVRVTIFGILNPNRNYSTKLNPTLTKILTPTRKPNS